MRRTLAIVAAALAGLGLLAGCTTQEFHIERFVDGPPDKVWAVLADTSAYPDWNPVFVAVDGPYVEGETVTNSVREPDGRIVEIDASVDRVAPGEELRQSGGVPGFLTFDHRWLLVAENGGTKITQHEVDRGLGLWFWDSSWIEPAYASVSEALIARVLGTDG